jgi:hypothetical protein
MPPVPTTTTTIPPGACEPPDCNDNDLCTTDTCDTGLGCVHEPRDGFEGVTCHLDSLTNALEASTSSDLGGPLVQRRFTAKIRKTHRLVEVGEKTTGRRQSGKLRRASALLDTFIRSVQRGEQRGKIPPALADRLVTLASSAEAALLPLTP